MYPSPNPLLFRGIRTIMLGGKFLVPVIPLRNEVAYAYLYISV